MNVGARPLIPAHQLQINLSSSLSVSSVYQKFPFQHALCRDVACHVVRVDLGLSCAIARAPSIAVVANSRLAGTGRTACMPELRLADEGLMRIWRGLVLSGNAVWCWAHWNAGIASCLLQRCDEV